MSKVQSDGNTGSYSQEQCDSTPRAPMLMPTPPVSSQDIHDENQGNDSDEPRYNRGR